MSKLSAAIDVAAEYAAHLHRDDGIPKTKAISIASAAVIRAARRNPSHFVTHRKPKDTGMGWSGSTIMGLGSVLSAVGFVKNLVTGG